MSYTQKINGNLFIFNNVEISGNINIDGLTRIKGNLVLEDNGDNILSFSDFSSNTQNTQLPSINNQPISLTRISIFYNDISYNIPSSGEVVIPFGTMIKNQLNLELSGNNILPSFDISGQYIELYANIEIFTIVNNTDFSLDISGLGCDFYEIIDSRSVTKKNRKYYLTLGPHIFLPEQWNNCNEFVFKIINNISNSFNVIKTKIVFKSYYL
jgi:hypothetical protein